MRKVGRPTTYSPSLIKKVEEYITSCQDEEYQVTKYEGEKSTGYETKLRVNFPSIEGCALYLKVHKETLYNWESRHPEFSDVIAKLRQEQAQRLLNNGLSGAYNPTIAKVILTKHGYREGIEQTGSEGKPLIPDTGDIDVEKMAAEVAAQLKLKKT